MNIVKWKFSLFVTAIIGQVLSARGEGGSRASNYETSLVNQRVRDRLLSPFGIARSSKYDRSSCRTSSGIGGTTALKRFNQDDDPHVYGFNYQLIDEQGNSHYRREGSDENGTVRGAYGYFTNQGLHRYVDYIADANGFRARIITNEPGTDGKVNPADVQMIVKQPPSADRGTDHRPQVYHDYVGGEVEQLYGSDLPSNTDGVIVRHEKTG